jgi:hypothetical protein
VTDEQATGTPQQNLPQEENRPADQQESDAGGGDSAEGKAEQRQESDTGGTAGGDAEQGSSDGAEGDDDEVAKARKAAEEEEAAKEKVKELEDNPPEKLEDWPDDKAKYETFGGAEGEESYEESVTSKLGPSSLRFREDGGVEIEGEEVDDPDEYKGDPIPGGPTDPDATELAGERKRREKEERMYGGPGKPGQPREEYLEQREQEGNAGGDGQPSGDDEGGGGEG